MGFHSLEDLLVGGEHQQTFSVGGTVEQRVVVLVLGVRVARYDKRLGDADVLDFFLVRGQLGDLVDGHTANGLSFSEGNDLRDIKIVSRHGILKFHLLLGEDIPHDIDPREGEKQSDDKDVLDSRQDRDARENKWRQHQNQNRDNLDDELLGFVDTFYNLFIKSAVYHIKKLLFVKITNISYHSLLFFARKKLPHHAAARCFFVCI